MHTKLASRIDKDMLPIDTINPTPSQRTFLHELISQSTAHARGVGISDFGFQGYQKYRYFCAYKSEKKKTGFGNAVFGFERKRTGMFMVFPASVPEPKGIAIPWTQKSSPKRKKY
jgi:hypothetical protein